MVSIASNSQARFKKIVTIFSYFVSFMTNIFQKTATFYSKKLLINYELQTSLKLLGSKMMKMTFRGVFHTSVMKALFSNCGAIIARVK